MQKQANILFTLNWYTLEETAWPQEDRTGQGRVEGVHFSDHHGTADALMDQRRRTHRRGLQGRVQFCDAFIFH